MFLGEASLPKKLLSVSFGYFSLQRKVTNTKGLAPVYYEGCYVVTPRIVRAHTEVGAITLIAPLRVPLRYKKEAFALKKGAQIKSYLISHALITAGFKM